MNTADTLIKDITKKINFWDERSNFTLKGIRNLSMSDLDMIKFYANNYAKYGNVTNYGEFMKPLGDIAEVLKAYDIPLN